MENTNFYNEQNLIEIKSTKRHKKGQTAVARIEAAAFLMIASAPLVNNSTNYVNPKPKQQIIQNVQEKGDVDMSNNKDTSTQEVRQQDLDSLEKLFNEKLKTSTTYFDGKFDTLSQKIEGIKSNIDKEADRRYKRTNLLITVIGIVVPVVVQIIFKFIK